MLETRANFDFEVVIASVGFNLEFQKRCDSLNVGYIGLSKNSLTDAYKELYEISKRQISTRVDVFACSPQLYVSDVRQYCVVVA